jgi:trans-aconitate 2-methyltransferase
VILDAWNPAQYHRFADARLRPAVDLLARVTLDDPAMVYDLGCGSGRTTNLLAQRWPGARVVGVDASAKMLAAARQSFPHLDFVQADLARWSPVDQADLLFSNAALHWLDDHPALFRRLMELVAPRGQLAVQMPRNHDQPSHRAIAAAAEAGPWHERLRPLLRPSPVSSAAAYHAILAPQAARIDIWETTYLHVLDDANPVAEWVKGTALSPLLEALEDRQRAEFEACYRALVAESYPPDPQGRTLFAFRRLFLVAGRGARG